jgi:hypothetical protein
MTFFCFKTALVLAASMGFASQAVAAPDDRAEFPPIYTMSPKSVNIQTGLFVSSSTEFSVGPLSFVRHKGGPASFNGAGGFEIATPFGYWNHNQSQGIRYKSYGPGGIGTLYVVVVDGKELQFIINGGNPDYWAWNQAAQGWMLKKSGAVFTATNSNGDAYVFQNIPGLPAQGGYPAPYAALIRIEYADGHRVDYSYDASARTRLVSSNRGYAIVIDYNASGMISAACGFNSANNFVTTATTCTSSAALVKTSYAYNADSTLASVTQANGSVVYFTYYRWSAKQLVATISLPNAPSTYEIQNFFGIQPGEPSGLTHPDQVRRQITATGDTWLYNYEPYLESELPQQPGELRPTYSWVTYPTGGQTEAKYINGVLKYTSGPSEYTEYVFNGLQPEKVIHVEGNIEFYPVDYAGNVTGVTRKAKPGSGLPDIVSSSTYPTANIWSAPTICNAASQKLCNKPTSVVDAKGNQSDFTYDPAHGGVLTETGPAVNGVRPQTRYTYAQQSAIVRTSATAFGAASPPIYVLTQKAHCKTGNPNATNTGCAIVGDEVIVTYEYGPTTTTAANNLLLRGEVVDPAGLHLRTCYTYDAQGNKLTERKPLGAGTTTCP